MPKLGTLARIRSKNAGPFWITIDLFCHDGAYDQVAAIPSDTFCRALRVAGLQRFNLPDIQVVKLSLPRPQIQGSARDRDMHGAALAHVLTGIEIATDAPEGA
ncbi:MAG: DUF4387 family protein [Pseudomonadota bacterium]